MDGGWGGDIGVGGERSKKGGGGKRKRKERDDKEDEGEGFEVVGGEGGRRQGRGKGGM